jgi:hypothetical protein
LKAWFQKLIGEADGSPSTRRLLFIVAVVFVLGFCAGDFTANRSISPNAVSLLQTVLYATGGAVTIGRFAEASENKPAVLTNKP